LETSITPPAPRPFIEIPDLWLKVFVMDETFLAAEAPRASSRNTMLAMIGPSVGSIFSNVIRNMGTPVP